MFFVLIPLWFVLVLTVVVIPVALLQMLFEGNTLQTNCPKCNVKIYMPVCINCGGTEMHESIVMPTGVLGFACDKCHTGLDYLTCNCGTRVPTSIMVTGPKLKLPPRLLYMRKTQRLKALGGLCFWITVIMLCLSLKTYDIATINERFISIHTDLIRTYPSLVNTDYINIKRGYRTFTVFSNIRCHRELVLLNNIRTYRISTVALITLCFSVVFNIISDRRSFHER